MFLVLLYAQAGYYLQCRLAQWQQKEAVKEWLLAGLPDAALDIIPLNGNENNIEWEKPGLEFSLHGKMFDVVRTKTVAGQTLYYCSSDEKEDELLDKIIEFTKSGPHPGKNSKLPVLQLVFCIPGAHSAAHHNISPDSIQGYIHYLVPLQRQSAAVIAPPPRCVA